MSNYIIEIDDKKVKEQLNLILNQMFKEEKNCQAI